MAAAGLPENRTSQLLAVQNAKGLRVPNKKVKALGLSADNLFV
jgi:hypothetical protein